MGHAGIVIDHLLVSYDNNGTFALNVEHLTYKTEKVQSSDMLAGLDEMKGAIN